MSTSMSGVISKVWPSNCEPAFLQEQISQHLPPSCIALCILSQSLESRKHHRTASFWGPLYSRTHLSCLDTFPKFPFFFPMEICPETHSFLRYTVYPHSYGHSIFSWPRRPARSTSPALPGAAPAAPAAVASALASAEPRGGPGAPGAARRGAGGAGTSAANPGRAPETHGSSQIFWENQQATCWILGCWEKNIAYNQCSALFCCFPTNSGDNGLK